jgi:fatty-acyl-CoA synthase
MGMRAGLEFGARLAGQLAADGVRLDADDVVEGVKRQLAAYKAPRHVVVVDHVPRAPNGKADYRAARELALATVATT